MLFECSVTSISDYGAEIWGFSSKEAVNKIHLRAARCFLGLPKHATSAGVLAEISWPEPVCRAQIRMIRQYFRILKMEDDRLTKKIYFWDKAVSVQRNIQTWSSEVRTILYDHNQGHRKQFLCTVHYKEIKRKYDCKTSCKFKTNLFRKAKAKNFCQIQRFWYYTQLH